MLRSSRFAAAWPLLSGLLLAAACETAPSSPLIAPTAPSDARLVPVPAYVTGPAIGASWIHTVNPLLRDRVVLVDDPFGTLVGNAYEFSAKPDSTGHATGTFDFFATYHKTKVHLSGAIVCYTVLGNKARVGGIVTRSDFAPIPVGTTETWSLTDNGAPSSHAFDTSSSFLGGDANYALGYCANGLPYTERAVIGGKVVITP